MNARYRAVRGKLAAGDSRNAYVLGPDVNGRICPVASFWTFEDAERWAQERNEREPYELALRGGAVAFPLDLEEADMGRKLRAGIALEEARYARDAEVCRACGYTLGEHGDHDWDVAGSCIAAPKPVPESFECGGGL